jgi:hypothetical protein
VREWLRAWGLVLGLCVGAARAQEEVKAVEAVEAVASSGTRPVYTEVVGTPESELDDGLRITVATSALSPERGYLPVQVLLHDTRGKARVVDIVVTASMAGGAEVVRRRVEVGARQEVSAWLPMPVDAQGGLVRVTGPGLAPHAFSFYSVKRDDAVLVLGTRQEFDASSGLSPVEDHSGLAVRFIVPAQAPRELASYVGYPMVVVTGDVTALPADVWSALEAYSATGGSLVLLRPSRDVATRLPLLNAAATTQSAHPHGFGWVLLCDEVMGCGSVLESKVSALRRGHTGSVEPASGEFSRYDSQAFEALLPGVRAPVGRFILLLSLFVLLVGPGGLWLVRRKGPVALLLTVPAVSLVTCLAMVLWSVFVDGLALRASLFSFTLLDRPRDRALTVGLGAYYANLEPEGLAFSSLGVLLPPWQGASRTSPLEVDWSQGPVVTGGFLPSRTYREWGELGLVSSRLRLSVRSDADGPTVLNALGAPLESGYLQWSGSLWRVPRLAEGAEGRAQRTSGREVAEFDSWMVGGVARRFGRDVLAQMRAPLSEGEFLARLEGKGPFTATRALDVELHQGQHVVRGRVDKP